MVPKATSYRWVALGWFLGIGSLLSYGGLSSTLRLQCVLWGYLLPLYFLSRLPPDIHPVSDPPTSEAPWIGAAVAWMVVIGFILRWTVPGSRITWPMVDDSVFGWYSLRILETGKIPLTFTYGQFPPLLVYLQALAWSFVQPSWSNLWDVPLFFSLIASALAYPAMRSWTNRPIAFWFAAGMCFCFWGLYAGRFLISASLFLSWMMAALWALGAWRPGEGNGFLRALGVGALSGLSAWISPLAFVGIPAAGILAAWKTRRARAHLAPWVLGCLAVSSPFLWEAFQGRYGNYATGLMADSARHLNTALFSGFRYLFFTLWGGPERPFAFGPFWGGFLNPVWGALATLGVAQCLRNWKSPGSWVSLGLAAFLFSPGFVAGGMEFFRIFAAFPAAMALAALGASSLMRFEQPRSLAMAVLLLLSAAALDVYHLSGPFRRWATEPSHWEDPSRRIEHREAVNLLELEARANGPGLLFLDFTRDSYNPTPVVLTYAFNAARNPRLDPDSARWIGILADRDTLPFLKLRFPDGRWHDLAGGPHRERGEWILGLIPRSAAAESVWNSWLHFEHSIQFESGSIWDLSPQAPQPGLIRGLHELWPQTASDPFLVTCWAYKLDKAYQHETAVWAYRYKYSRSKTIEGLTFMDRCDPLFRAHSATLQTAFQRGYPVADLKLTWSLVSRNIFPDIPASDSR